MNFHPDLLKLISKENLEGYYCPICSSRLEVQELTDQYVDWNCEKEFGHRFKIYESNISSGYYKSISFLHFINSKRYNISFNFENKEVGFFHNLYGRSINFNNYDFVSIEDLINRVDTYVMFS